MELYRKYRPAKFGELIGNKQTKASIQDKIENDNLPHALLFTGASGTGKTTIGRIIAKEIGAMGPNGHDYTEIDTADFRGIDSVREIRRNLSYPPVEGTCRVWLLDEVHQLGQGGSSSKNPAQNALLKALEDPPDHAYFILCTTDPQMLMPTIKSRCTTYEMETLNEDQLSVLIKRVLKKEDIKLKKPIIKRITNAAQGRPRDALTILEKIIHLPQKDMAKQIKKEQETESGGFKLAQILFKAESWQKAIPVLQSLKNENPESIRQVIFSYMVSVTAKGSNERAHYIMYCFEDPLFTDGYNKLWYICHGILNGFEV